MSFMFFGNTVFNQDVSGWDVSNVNDMSAMFAGSISFNQNIGGWNVSNVTNMTFFLSNATSFTSTNLDNIYNGWSALPSLQSTVTFDAESICYNSSAQAGRDILTNTYGWIITDNGICPTPTPTPTSTPTPTVTQTNTPTTTVTPTKTTTPTPTSTQLYFLLFEDDSIATAENNDNIEIDII
jgi:surface protein